MPKSTIVIRKALAKGRTNLGWPTLMSASNAAIKRAAKRRSEIASVWRAFNERHPKKEN